MRNEKKNKSSRSLAKKKIARVNMYSRLIRLSEWMWKECGGHAVSKLIFFYPNRSCRTLKLIGYCLIVASKHRVKGVDLERVW